MTWHVNPTTGQPSKCAAKFNCPFGGDFNGHSPTRKEALKVYEEFAGGVFDSTKTSYNYAVTDEAKEAFSSGDCGGLAESFNKLYGLPTVASGIKNGDEPIEWQHMLALTPDKRLLDVNDLYTSEDAETAWRSLFLLKSNAAVIFKKLTKDEEWESLLDKQKGSVNYPTQDPDLAAKQIVTIYENAGLQIVK